MARIALHSNWASQKLSCFTDMSFVQSVLDTPWQCCLVESLHNYKCYSNRSLFNFQDFSWMWFYADIFCGLQMILWLILRTPFLLFIDSRRYLIWYGMAFPKICSDRKRRNEAPTAGIFPPNLMYERKIDNELGPCSPIIMWHLEVAC